MNRRNLSGVRQLGLEVEPRVVDALNANGITARHAEPEEDLSGWDVEINLNGYTIWIDLTISRSRLQKKQTAEPVRNGLIIAVLVDPEWPSERLFRETIRQVIYSLPDRVKTELLREMATLQH